MLARNVQSEAAWIEAGNRRMSLCHGGNVRKQECMFDFYIVGVFMVQVKCLDMPT